MRMLVIVVAALATLGLAAFGVIAAQKINKQADAVARNAGVAPPNAIAAKSAQTPGAPPWQATIVAPPVAAPAAMRIAQNTTANSAPKAAGASDGQTNAGGTTNGIPACDKSGAMGLARIVEIDTTGGPAFGFEHFKQYDFLHDHEVVLTFDDGPWPQNTPAVIKALTDQCLKATFFEIGEHATWHPELSKLVAAAGMTIGSHTWSHKDLARNPYANDIELGEQEIELGISAVSRAVGSPIAPFFRFPDLQQPPALLTYLASRNIAIFSTDIDSFDFKIRRPQRLIDSVMTKLKKRGKGILLMHDFQHVTAEALPELLHQLQANGYKIVHMVPKASLTTLAKYDDMLRQQDKLDANNTRPLSSVVHTISR